MIFSEIFINRDDIPQDILNIDIKTRTNPFAWNGQFSPQFIEALLEKYSQKDSYVIDPFAGSGTTLYECARKRLTVYGAEINASAFHMAKIYESASLAPQKKSSVLDEIDSLIFCLSMNSRDILGELVREINNRHNTFYADVLSALVVMMDIFRNEITAGLLLEKWKILAGIIAGIPHSDNTVKIERCDARFLTLEDNTADLLITSPPYINVFNYHQKYRRSVEALGYDVLTTAKSEIGSNRKNRSNRFLTVIQYCIDMAMAMREAGRGCKDGARMIYVVGRESRVMGCPFCNSELIYNIGTEILGFGFIMRQERVFRNRYGQMIYEDILHFRNIKDNNGEIQGKAADIAVSMLKEKLEYADDRTTPLLTEAIIRKDTVNQSERFIP